MDGSEPKTLAEGAEGPSSAAAGAADVPTPADPAIPAQTETPPGASMAPLVEGGSLDRTSRIGKATSRLRVALALAGGAALVVGIAVPATLATRSEPPASVTAAVQAGLSAGTQAAVDEAGVDAAPALAEAPAVPRPTVWRVAQLSQEPNVALAEGVIARRPLLTVLGAAGLPNREAQRVARSLADVRDVDHFGSKDTFTLARDKSSGRVIAYEIASSPTDVWQAREDGDAAPRLVARKLDLPSERVRVRKAILVGSDLRASFTDAGLSPIDDVLAMLDDALEGHAELTDIRQGARLRLVATQERVDGAFARWASLDAVEYVPAAPNAPAVRVYWLPDEERSREHRSWYDAKGRQPYHGGFRFPVPLTRIASRFDPHRMHPVLHVVMPHNGVDFAAPSGAPVYATAPGVVTSVGPSGPCGNKVEIQHSGGIASVYCHLSRFAAGLHIGQHVESRQLIAYVGQTGRVTGPHLHFGIKRNGEFIDPMTLRLDSVRVVPHGRRDEFDHVRGLLDAELDGIPLPAPGVVPAPEPTEPADTFYEEP